MGQHDLGYRALFSFPRMVEELVSGFVDEPWVEQLDFTTLQRVNASYVSPELASREGDLLWKVRLRDGRALYVYLLIEHQSQVERFMAVRLMTYIGLLYQDLLKQGELTPDGRLPLIFPLVLYNGRAGWWAPEELADLVEPVDGIAAAYVPHLRYFVIDESRYSLEELEPRNSVTAQIFWLEQSRGRKDLGLGTGRLVDLLRGPENEALRRVVLVWIAHVLLPRPEEGRPIPEVVSLEEFKAMLDERVVDWNHEIRVQGRQEGRQEGRREGEAALLLRQLERKFGRLDLQVLERVQAADAERLLDWGERVLTAERLEDIFEN